MLFLWTSILDTPELHLSDFQRPCVSSQQKGNRELTAVGTIQTTMCGGGDPATLANRFGALAVLSPTPCTAGKTESGPQPDDLSGNIVFYNRESPDSLVATHMKFITSDTAYPSKHSSLQVGLQ